MAKLADAADLKSAAFGRGGSIPPSGISTALVVLVLGVAFLVRAWFGHFDLTGRRFFDEQFALENVGRILVTGEVRPANGYHPTLSYLPQVAVLGALQGAWQLTGDARLRPLGDEPVIEHVNRPDQYPFTPAAFLAGRWMQALLGTLAVALTFALGRLVGGTATGLAAAAVVAVVPLLVRQSALINEDAGLVATTLGAVLTAALAGARGTLRSSLVAGAAVGLACASKFNGVAAALPLVAVTLAHARDRRAWIRLAAAGAAAALVFLLLDPFVLSDLRLYQTDFGRTFANYEDKGDLQGRTHLGVFVSGMTSALQPSFLGPVAGTVALLGLALLAWRAVAGRGAGDQERAAAQAVVGFALGYPLLYAIATRNVSLHNWLPMLPLLAVAAAAGAFAAVGWVERRTAWRAVPAALAAALALLLVAPPLSVTYGWVVPPTVSVAGDRLADHLRPLHGRLVFVEGDLDALRVARRDGVRAAVVRSDLEQLAALDSRPTADALVVRRETERGSPALRRITARGRLLEVIEPRLGLRRGPALALYHMGWQRVGRERRAALDCVRRRGWTGTVAAPPARFVSLALWERRSDPPTEARIAGHPTRLRRVELTRGRALLYSDKVDLGAPASAALPVEVDTRCTPGRQLGVRLLGWAPPAGEAAPATAATAPPADGGDGRPAL